MRLLGLVMIGPHTQIEPDAIVIGPTVIGRRCQIQRGTVISQSAVWDECRIGTGARLDRCVVPDRTQLGAGVVQHRLVCRGNGAALRRPGASTRV